MQLKKKNVWQDWFLPQNVRGLKKPESVRLFTPNYLSQKKCFTLDV